MVAQTKIAEPTVVNGINLDDLFALIDGVRRDAAKSKTNWRVTTTWQGQTRSLAQIEGFGIGGERVPRRFSIDIDEPSELGGTNRFANPQEHLLAALNACMMVGYVAQCDASASTDAERRQLTVMFCDLVGSTPLSTRFDPEDLREIVGAYHRCVTDTVGRFGGFVAKYMGDGVLVYFGYPEAHEDDAERAGRAGLAVIDAVGRLAAQEPLNVRIGIASGLVVVGDLIGAGAAQERGVVGETPNLAA